MKFKRLTALLLCLAMLAAMAGCTETPVETQPTTVPTTVPEPTVEELYSQAAADLLGEEYIRLDADITRTTTVGVDTFTKTMEQNFTWKDLGTEEMRAKLVESVTIGDETQRITEVFRDGEVYQTVDSLAFVSEQTAEDFASRWIDPVPLELERYASITKEENAEGTLIRFEEAEELEDWAAPEYAILEQASGTAQLDAEGKLTGFTYTAVFAQGAAKIELDVQVTVLDLSVVDLTLSYPADDERYVLIGAPQIPRVIFETYNYLEQAKSITTSGFQYVSSDAMPNAAVQYTDIATWGRGEDHMSEVELTVIKQINRATSSYSTKETFRDGEYTYRMNGSKHRPDNSVTSEMRYTAAMNMVFGQLPDLDQITGAVLTDFDGICVIEMDCAVELAQTMSHEMMEHLIGASRNPKDRDELVNSHKTTAMNFYVVINTDTGLPVSSGANFSGIQIKNDTPYNMTYQSYQSILASSEETYDYLTREDDKNAENPVEQEPEEKATPLFYHVTGADGQEMWLMGTIHIGDERTGFLPQEIYDALDSSSALAVEFDPEAFEKKLQKDDNLAKRANSTYLYADGSSIVDHVDPMLCAAGFKLMKAAGYSMTEIDVLKPHYWGSMIEDFYMGQGYSKLEAEKGVDNRLMARAREKKIQILDVESGIDQMEMLGGYSDGVQQMLLASAVGTPCAEYNNRNQELFELWCKGDEAALIEYLKDDTSDMNKWEKAIYDEYNREMSTKRNAKMLEVAKGYLESGDVVFYAVGLAHLLAEDGLVNTLREAGYTVELVTYAE